VSSGGGVLEKRDDNWRSSSMCRTANKRLTKCGDYVNFELSFYCASPRGMILDGKLGKNVILGWKVQKLDEFVRKSALF
jgi:hypothetical protein